jgi:deazaflavin-dependent oxidoreductase (nitroreductase family)
VTRLRRAFFRAPIGLYRLGLGWLLGRRFLLLVHTGRKSGLRRGTVLEVVGDEGPAPIVVSGFGPGSDWFRNLIANPVVEVTWARERFAARASVLPPPEAVEVFRRYRIAHSLAARALGRALGVSILDDPEGAAAAMPVVRLDSVSRSSS